MQKNTFLLFLICLLFVPVRIKAQEAYAVYDDGVLTFYYDNSMDSRDGTVYELENKWDDRPFYNKRINVTEVIFTKSFSKARPTSTYAWFAGMKNLTSIVGIQYLNTSQVTDMSYMFSDCSSLTTLDVGSFNTSNVTDMSDMFYYCSSLTTLDVGSFNTSNVTDMSWMFCNCLSLTTLDVGSFNTSNVTDMSCMFSGCSSLTTLDVGSFNTSQVTDMSYMFSDCSSLTTLDVGSFNTSNVTDMSSMFYYCSSLTTLDVDSFDTSNVTNMDGMFWGCQSLSHLDISNFNTSIVTDMGDMFDLCSSLSNIDVGNFDTSNVTDMCYMFAGCSSLSNIDLGNFDTSNVTTMEWMFSYSGIVFLDLTNFDTSNVTNMKGMFYGCDNLSTIYVGELWNLENVTASDYLFGYCRSLVGGMGTQFEDDQYDISYAHIDEGASNPGYLTYKPFIGDCTFSDVPKTNAYFDATCYLSSYNVLNGTDNNGKMEVENPLTRAHLAKIAFRGVYSVKGRFVYPGVPEAVPSDNYPVVYNDLTDKTKYYYQPARALLYLEYGDGVAPFDRNRLDFAPEENIARIHVLKVLMETFNIQPDMEGTDNPFPQDANVVALAKKDPRAMGYIRKAAALGIITKANSEFRPYANCLRGEGFVMLYRIMKAVEIGTISDPNPQESDYFQPLNTTLKTIALGMGMSLGNFNHYTKTSFTLNGTMPLAFAHHYNSYNTTLPEVFFGAGNVDGTNDTYQPMGDGWSHNYHSFITIVGKVTSPDARVILHWGGGKIDVYKSDGTNLVPESYGVYDEMTLGNKEVIVKTKSQVEYHFAGLGSSTDTGAAVYYLSAIKDRNGNTLTLNYENGVNGSKRIRNVSADGRSLTFSYLSGTDLVEKVIDPLGRSIKFGYTLNSQTGHYQLSTFTDAKNQTTTYSYGDASKVSTSKLLTRIQLPKGNYIENEYDANYRLKKTTTGKYGLSTTQTNVNVTANYGSTVSTSSQVDVTRGSGQISSFNYTFNDNNVITKMTGEEGLYFNSGYTNSNHPHLPTSIRTNKTNISNLVYDDKGNITSITVKGDGTLTTKMTYDEMNNLTSVTDPKGYKTTYTYDGNGNLVGVSAPENVTSSIIVNSKGLPTEVTNAMGVKTEFEYNSYGNLKTAMLPALSLSSSAIYDDASRLTSVTDALGRSTSYTYDENDNLTNETDAANHKTDFGYDANDNLTSITNAKGGVTYLSYDNVTDWLTEVSFAGATKQYEYNHDGTLNRYTKPDGTSLSYSYDNLGRVTYDGYNSYTYDSKLRLSSISGGGRTISFSYDGFNRIIGTSCDSHNNSYTYDKNSNCISVNNTTYTYDKLNRLKTVSFGDKTITYTYRKDSKMSKVSYPNGMTTTFGYDGVGRLTSKTTKLSNGTVIAKYTFTLDKVGNITKQTSQEPFNEMELTNEDVSYTYNSGNRITQAGNIYFSFDANGNTTQRGSENYSWDVRDCLSQAGSTRIEYDPLGFIASYGNITFITDPLGIGNVLSDSKSGAEYIYGNGLEARILNGVVSYYVTDVRGSVVAIVDDNGNITHKYQYDEFGKVTQKEEADYNPFQYVGKYGVMNLSDHLYYMRARHYDPTIGRFLSEDPIWSTNLYPYVDNNPIIRIDPRGKSYEPIYEDPYSEFKQLLVGRLPDYYIEYDGCRELAYAIVIEGKNGEPIQKKVTYNEYVQWREKQGIYVVNVKSSDKKESEQLKKTQGSSSPTTNLQTPNLSNTSNIHYGIDFSNLNTNSIRGINPWGDYTMDWFEAQPEDVKRALARYFFNFVGL